MVLALVCRHTRSGMLDALSQINMSTLDVSNSAFHRRRWTFGTGSARQSRTPYPLRTPQNRCTSLLPDSNSSAVSLHSTPLKCLLMQPSFLPES